MPKPSSREIRLAFHPKGGPTANNFTQVQAELEPLQDQQVLVCNVLMLLDAPMATFPPTRFHDRWPMARLHDDGISTGGGEASRLDDPAREKKKLEAQVAVVGAGVPGEPRLRERVSCGGEMAVKPYLRAIAKVKPLTPRAEIALAARIKKGNKKARTQLIKANLPLVVEIARGFEGVGLPLLDLISEGNIGLINAVARFDPASERTLATYASWWIKHSIKRALASQPKRA